ncbi:putative phosphatase Rv3661 [Rubritalea halochordaticola]|uniref:Phosphatase Rv3661 n=1 Tax=Rubritalea halochordaticola TaxID=714537 RepID=A0ABP9UUL1_9BACT
MKGYALFDLDQTIVPWDTQLLFCNFVLKKEPLRRLHVLGFLPFLPFNKLIGTEGMKRVFLNYLYGLDQSVLDAYAKEFVDELMEGGLYDEIVDEVKRQKSEGRLTILNSASPEIWVKYLGPALGFDHWYGTRVVINGKVDLFPDIYGGNNKGAVKLGRMKKHFPEGWSEGDVLPNSWGYSDSHADIPMLDICEHNVMVHPTSKLLEYGQRRGWEVRMPKRPTANRTQFGIACFKQMLGVY